MLASAFMRHETHHSTAHLIHGLEWFTVNKDGKGCVMTTGPGSAPTPPDYVMMALGACAGNGIKFQLDKAGIKYTKLDVDIDGTFTDKPQLRVGDMKLTIKTDAQISKAKLDEIVTSVETKTCPVAGTLSNAPKIHHEIILA